MWKASLNIVKLSTMARKISADAIVDAAFVVLDEHGADGLTLRAVAGRLDVQAPALYWHVRDKQQMLDEMATAVWRQVAIGADWERFARWEDALTAYARRTRQALLAHRDGARMFGGTRLTDPAVLQGQEPAIAWMQGQGFALVDIVDAVALITSFTIGHSIEEQARIQAEPGIYDLATRDRLVGAAAHPLVAAVGHAMAEGGADAHFERQLGVLVAGIRTMLA